MITDNLIKKYGTHFLLTATLGGEEALTIFVDKRKLSKKGEVSDFSGNSSTVTLEALHQLAASYFIDRESTLRKLHHIQIASTAIKVTETRTGPLGCSNYDNLDSVSSVLVQSPENKVQLQGLQVILPDYLRESFVQAALSYIACNGEGEFFCKDNDCWCNCDHKFPECNCPYMDIQAMEESLERITETWELLYKEFEESGKEILIKNKELLFLLNLCVCLIILAENKSCEYVGMNSGLLSAPLNLIENPIHIYLPLLYDL
ncbi:BMP/retinoic acid-inducible neural-specific protein 3 [Ataeniobius toweri]|uniref:BMP/retinoic acid-inducible neural-specific protein 3 n=1 Tax=Ataeniobius toweri TaxID=208326 RepID=A0ABU7BEC8_9TELE|nr:BMP/retinoic acid-inducible neural-specific protein 3 [Ataeniobius toweri]